VRHLKRINDTHGHAVGDQVIHVVADTLKASCRDVGTVGRYGGEEFVVFLPGLDADAAVEVAERVRIAVLALVGSGRLPIERLSSSFGVSDLAGGAKDGAALVDHADQALYASKESGRNRVSVHGRVPVPPVADAVVSPSNDDLSRAKLVELEMLVRQRERDRKMESTNKDIFIS